MPHDLFYILFHAQKISSIEYLISNIKYQGGLNKKRIQLNFCNIFSILIFNELYLFT